MSRLGRHAGLRLFRVFARTLQPGQNEAGAPECRVLDEGEALALCADASLELAPARVQAAFARGDLCVGAFHRGELAGYCWFAFAPAPHLDRAWIGFPAEVVYTYKSYVRPAFRGRGIAAAMYRHADRAALERGRRHAIICVESHNAASIAAARRAGFSAAGYAAYAGGERLRAWCSGAAARYGLSFFVPQA